MQFYIGGCGYRFFTVCAGDHAHYCTPDETLAAGSRRCQISHEDDPDFFLPDPEWHTGNPYEY